MKKHIILIPTDFTKVAETAVNHGVEIAKTANGEIVLLHVVPKKEDVAKSRTKVEAAAAKNQSESGIPTRGIIRIGNIFDDIGDAASELNAKLIVMGTHGVKGIQHLTGSYALKVITNSKVPFIVVQQKVMKGGYKNIVLPIDLSRESKQKLKFAQEMAKYFESKVHLITPKESDEFLANQLSRNLGFAKKYLKEHGIDFSTKIAGSGGFVKEVLKFSAEIDADLISIMNVQGGGLSTLFSGPYEQQIMTNEGQIPVMIANPATVTVSGGVFST